MDIVERLRQHAHATARATQMIADAKSSRNETAGDVGASYCGLRREETVEWKAADEIERLRAALNPFAEAGGSMSARHNDFHGALSALCLNDLRRAHEAFTHEQKLDSTSLTHIAFGDKIVGESED